MRRVPVALLASALLGALLPGAADAGFAWQPGRNDVVVEMRDGTLIDATMVVPADAAPGDELPAIIVIHGYGGSKPVSDAEDAAERGYVGFAYSTRGFGRSTGRMDVAGPASIADLKELIVWLKAKGPVDDARVGVTGASYGGGHALQIATHRDAGVATVVPIVPWSDLAQALAPNDVFKYSYTTGFYATGNGLVQDGDDPMELEVLGQDLGRRCLCDTYDPAVHRWYVESWTGVATDDARAAMAERSAVHRAALVDIPVFILQGLNDDLFPGDQALEMFERIPTSEKRLYLGYVGHPRADPDTDSPEAQYLLPEVYAWFDHYLKGIGPRPFDPAAPIEVGNRPWNGRTTNLSHWPQGEEGGLWTFGADGLLAAPDAAAVSGVAAITNTYVAGLPDDPVIPYAVDEGWSDLPRGTAADTLVFRSGQLTDDLTLLGTPRAELRITPGAVRHQVAVKVFDRAPGGDLELVTRGVRGTLDALPGVETTLVFDLQPYHHTFAAGHEVEVQVAASDFPTYWPYANPFSTALHLGAGVGLRMSTA